MGRKAVILDYRTSIEIINKLQSLGLDTILSCPCENLPWQVNGHPDLMYHKISKELGCIALNCFGHFIKEFTQHRKILRNRIFIKGESAFGSQYPEDIHYNVLRMGNFAFGKLSAIDNRLRAVLLKQGVEFVEVNQGYAKCSVAVTSKTSAITSDKGIARELEIRGMRVLLLEPGGIDLPGYEYGFIGGASGLIENKFFLTGRFLDEDINKKVESFVMENGSEMIYLSEGKIIDIGSILEV